MFGALLGGAGLGAIGIGALIGGLGAKQRGGNFLKGALSGAALGGITGGLGAKYADDGGMFGFGKKLLPNFLAMSGIGMGTEMFGQQEANRNALEARRRIFQEDEDERIARLSRIAGYDVADPKNFMTPQSYFGAEGGMISRPQYQFGGISSLEDDPAEAVDIQELQMDPGTMGPGELVEEFDFMEEAGSDADESGWYEMFFNEFGRPPVDINEFQLFKDNVGSDYDISPTDVARGAGQGPMMAAEGGQVNRPGYFPGGLAVAMAKLAQKGKVEDAIKGSDVVDEEIYMTEDEDENGGGIWDSIKESILTPSGSNPTPGLIEESGGDTGAAGFVKRALGEVTEDARSDVMKAIIMEARLKQPEGPLLQDTIDTVAKAFMSSGIFSGSEEEVDDSMKFMQGRYDDFINDAVDTGGSDIPPGFDPYMYAKGGRVNARFGGRQFSGLNFGGGFDRSGGERVFQAKTVDPGQKGVYESYRSLMHPLGGGVRLSPGGIDVNKAAQDYKDWRSTGGGFGGKDYGTSQKGENTARHIYNQYNLKNFSEKYPGAAGLGMTAEDVYNQQLLDEEAPEDYKWLAEGGIADLDLRGGGASFGPGTGTSDDIPAMLSDGEFVVTANAVRNLGGGDRMEGARRMYSMMNQLDPQSQSPAEMSGVGYA